jgi:HEAT repeat protein
MRAATARRDPQRVLLAACIAALVLILVLARLVSRGDAPSHDPPSRNPPARDRSMIETSARNVRVNAPGAPIHQAAPFVAPRADQEEPDERIETIVALVEQPAAHSTATTATIAATALSDGSAAVREEAVVALGDLRGTLSVQTLAQALEDVDENVREAAVDSLVQVGGAEARSLVRRALEDPAPSVREAAADALEEFATTASPAATLR